MRRLRRRPRIDLRGFRGEGLLFAGAADQMWQSEVAARALAEQNPGLSAVVYPEAGHLFSADITQVQAGWETLLGGTVKANRAAEEDSGARLLAALARWHA